MAGTIDPPPRVTGYRCRVCWKLYEGPGSKNKAKLCAVLHKYEFKFKRGETVVWGSSVVTIVDRYIRISRDDRPIALYDVKVIGWVDTRVNGKRLIYLKSRVGHIVQNIREGNLGTIKSGMIINKR